MDRRQLVRCTSIVVRAFSKPLLFMLSFKYITGLKFCYLPFEIKFVMQRKTTNYLANSGMAPSNPMFELRERERERERGDKERGETFTAYVLFVVKNGQNFIDC